ncbi:MAG: nitroreductase family protein [Candidatus Hatepunaea meridiana]|nr:nitroreductase family protein [Candidatus Hatepunaea meridiana]
MNYNDFDRLVAQTRSVRRFKANEVVTTDILRNLVNLARITPSSRNLQPLKYILVNSQKAREQLFGCLSWAGALKSWSGPAVDERPGGYIIIMGDTKIRNRFSCDHGITAQTMMLGARSRGLGGCIVASIDREKVCAMFNIDKRYEILLVLALGTPAEEVRIEPLPEDGNINYWRDNKEVHHVPKRALRDIIVKELTV